MRLVVYAREIISEKINEEKMGNKKEKANYA